MLDGKAFGEEIVGIVRDYVDKEVAPLKAENEALKERIAVLEARAPEKGEKGETGERGEKGAAGKDGIGATEFLIDRDNNLIVTLSDGSTKSLGQVVGRDGRDGVDGKDGERGEPGFSLEDFDIERGTDGRTFTLKFEQGDTRHEYELKFPAPVYCGVFKEGEAYEPGDMVTWAGSLWHCDAETKDKPGTDSWTLAVKKGRDGKDAKNG